MRHGGFPPEQLRPRVTDALGCCAAELDGDHGVERAVGDRDRIALEGRQIELETLDRPA